MKQFIVLFIKKKKKDGEEGVPVIILPAVIPVIFKNTHQILGQIMQDLEQNSKKNLTSNAYKQCSLQPFLAFAKCQNKN